MISNLPLQVGGAVRDPLAFASLTPGFNGQTANSARVFTSYYTRGMADKAGGRKFRSMAPTSRTHGRTKSVQYGRVSRLGRGIQGHVFQFLG